jgi:hypothetical protein
MLAVHQEELEDAGILAITKIFLMRKLAATQESTCTSEKS